MGWAFFIWACWFLGSHRFAAFLRCLPVYGIAREALVCRWGARGNGVRSTGGLAQLSAFAPHSVSVAHEVVIPLLADGTGEEPLTWEWRSRENPELTTRLSRPTLSTYSGGRALWRFTPLATDVGPLSIEFSAQSGPLAGSLELGFTIESGGDPPQFREPVGEGTTLDLRMMPCSAVSVVVESSSSPQVELLRVHPPPNAVIAHTDEL